MLNDPPTTVVASVLHLTKAEAHFLQRIRQLRNEAVGSSLGSPAAMPLRLEVLIFATHIMIVQSQKLSLEVFD